MTADVLSSLASSDLLAALSPAERARIAEVGRVEYWQQGALVLEEGAVGPRMMVLIEGRVQIIRRDPHGIQRTIAELGEGEVLGEMSLLLELPRTATVRALSDLKVFAMDRAAFQEMVEASDPAILKLGLQLSRVLAQRLAKLNGEVVRLMSLSGQSEVAEARQEAFQLFY